MMISSLNINKKKQDFNNLKNKYDEKIIEFSERILNLENKIVNSSLEYKKLENILVKKGRRNNYCSF